MLAQGHAGESSTDLAGPVGSHVLHLSDSADHMKEGREGRQRRGGGREEVVKYYAFCDVVLIYIMFCC